MATASSFECDSSGAYEEELFDLFLNSCFMEQMKAKAVKGSLKTIRFRSLCWKIFLDVLPPDRKDWVQVTRDLRNNYDELLEKYYVNPRTNINNPLCTSDLSTWKTYFEHRRLKQLIHQDVIRTFPDNDFFHSKEIQTMMTNILFVFACEQPSLQYKQGMHELLAPILLVIHKDVNFYLEAAALDDLELQVHIMFNQNYIEHDAYFMFCQTMVRVKPWYKSDCNYNEQAEEIDPVPNRFRTESLPNTMHYIWFTLLRSFDPDLYSHLKKLEISPQMFGIRWLRLLFGREFVMEDLLVLWDSIFADDNNLYQYIFAAMLISIRRMLLRGNYTSCLKYLMHFPHTVSVQCIIDLALHLRKPQDYKRPETRQKSLTLVEEKENKPIARKGFYGSTSLGKAETLLKKSFESRPKSLSVTSHVTSVDKLSRSPETTTKTRGSHTQSSVERWEPDSGGSLKTYTTSDCSYTLPRTPSEKWRSECEDPDLSNSALCTLPRTSIRNVMESKSHKFKASDLTQIPGVDANRRSEKPCQEMVEIFSTITSTPKIVQEIPIEIARKIQYLLEKVKRQKEKNEYCSRKMTHHLNQLRTVVMSQEKKDLDQAISAMDGLEMIRIILDEEIQFTPDTLRELSTEESMEVLSVGASQITLDSDPDSDPSTKKSAARDFKIYHDSTEND